MIGLPAAHCLRVIKSSKGLRAIFHSRRWSEDVAPQGGYTVSRSSIHGPSNGYRARWNIQYALGSNRSSHLRGRGDRHHCSDLFLRLFLELARNSPERLCRGPIRDRDEVERG